MPRARPLSLAALLLLAAPALATPTPEQRKVARLHYEKAVNHFNLGEYGPAGDEFREVYKAVPQPVILYDAAQAYRLADDTQQALTLYQSFLRVSPNAPVRAEVEKRIRDLQAQSDAKLHAARPPGDRPDEKPAPKTEKDKGEPKPEAKTEPASGPAPAKHEAKPDAPAVVATAKKADAGGSDRLKPVAELIRANRAGFRACFDKWSGAHPGVAGKVTLTFYLDPDGNIDQQNAETVGFEAPEVAGCIADFAETLKYPKSQSGKFTRFSYPFDFKPQR
jgi:tetratricopeptide (TPR) repeat protein